MKIGILGGSFDPAHKGHLAISKEARKRFKLEKIIWAITKKNPLKAESKTPISKKIKDCKKIIGLNSFIKVKFYENFNYVNQINNFILKLHLFVIYYFVIVCSSEQPKLEKYPTTSFFHLVQLLSF